MAAREVNIFGSCVTRDALEFAQGLAVGKYCARQSVISAVAPPPAPKTLAALRFNPGTHPFHKRCVEEDFAKTTLARLADRVLDEFVIVDFIEERMPLAETRCGTFVSYSQVATQYSNAAELVVRLVPAYSIEYVMLFARALERFAAGLQGRPVVLHRAFYAPDGGEHDRANRTLACLYDLATDALRPRAVIEVEPVLRAASATHKWGAAAYHYVDAYYRDFVGRYALQAQHGIAVKAGFSMQK